MTLHIRIFQSSKQQYKKINYTASWIELILPKPIALLSLFTTNNEISYESKHDIFGKERWGQSTQAVFSLISNAYELTKEE